MNSHAPRHGSICNRRRLVGALLSAAFAASSGRASAQNLTEVATGLPAPPFPCAVAGDYDGDGDADLVIAGTGKHDIPFTTIFNNTGGTFSDSLIALPGLSRATAAWGDYDGDGDLDLAMTGLPSNGVPATTVLRNDGSTFTALPGSFLGVFDGNLLWNDFDGDGDLDLLVTGVTAASSTGVAATRLYRNDGGDVFTSISHPFPDCYAGAGALGDYDGDGDLDLVLTGVTTSGALVASIWRDDAGTFNDIGANLPGMDLGFATFADYDLDGDLDLLFGGNSNDGFVSRIYRNDSGTFNDAGAGLLGLIWSSAAWGDWDGDGDPDAMLAGYDPVAQVHRSILYRNDSGSFVDSGAKFHDVILGTTFWFDHDNDGDLDLLLAGNENGADLLVLYDNDLSGKARWLNYGAGFPGSGGVPSFTARSAPVLGATLTLDLADSAPTATDSLIFVGFARAKIHSSFGGDLLVSALLALPLPIDTGGAALTGSIPNDPALTGVTVDLQALELDPGAAKGVSFTPGLELVLGL
jgi:VCBS repeat protein